MEQQSILQSLELSGIPETIENADLEGRALGIFEQLDMMVNSNNIEDCYWVKSSKDQNMVIVKLFRREDANKIRLSKKGLKGMNLSPLGINSTVYINDSLCTYHKILWSKCRKLFLKKYIHSFWVANGTNKLKTVENWLGYAVTHRNDLRELFPDCYIIDFIVHVSSQFLQSTFY